MGKQNVLNLIFSRTAKKQKFVAPPNINLLNADMVRFLGDYLEPESAHKMRRVSKQWNKVEIYENVSDHHRELAVFKHKNLGKILWKATEYKKPTIFQKGMIQNKKELVTALREEKWVDVVKWILSEKGPGFGSNDSFTKLLKATALEKVSLNVLRSNSTGYNLLTYVMWYGDTDSMLKLLERGVDVDQPNIRRSTAPTALIFFSKA